jgi:putative addiction module component (TIGR02574 family)
MLSTFEEILSTALALSLEQRAKLAEQLIMSLDDPTKEDAATQEEIDAAWAIEAERRMREIDEGKIELVDGELVMQKLRSRYKR